MAGYDDLVKAGLLNVGDQRDAALMGLFALGNQIGNRGAARLSPTPPPINLGAVMGAYQNQMQASMQRGALAKKLADDEGMRNIFAPKPYDEPMAQRMASVVGNNANARTMDQTEWGEDEVYEGYSFDPRSGDPVNDMGQPISGIQALGHQAGVKARDAALPLAREQTTVPTALRGMPQNAQSLISQVAEYNPKAALTMAGSVLAAQNKYRKPKYHNVTVDGVDAYMSTAEVEAAKAGGASLKPYARPPLVDMSTNAPSVMAEFGLETWKGAAEQADLAGQKLYKLGEMDALLKTGVQTGKLESMTLGIRGFFASFGVTDPDMPVWEAMQSLGNELALAKHGVGMGPMTDKDFEIYKRIVPNLTNTRAGNMLISHRIRREYIGQQMYAEILREQIKTVGAGNIDTRLAWTTVAQKLTEKLGPLIPEYESPGDVPESMRGRAIMLGGRLALVE